MLMRQYHNQNIRAKSHALAGLSSSNKPPRYLHYKSIEISDKQQYGKLLDSWHKPFILKNIPKLEIGLPIALNRNTILLAPRFSHAHDSATSRRTTPRAPRALRPPIKKIGRSSIQCEGILEAGNIGQKRN